MAFEKPIMTAPTDIITDDDGNVIRIVEHYRQGDHYYDIITNGNGDLVTMKYSTLSIKRELDRLGRWDATKALLTASGYWDDYVLANYLDEQDEVFKTACTAMVEKGIVTSEELKELLPRCVWTAD